ncbi:MAG: response regulator [Acidobacteriota bacterium]|nr:response regulator [Acidobacteriota bacterium]
MLKVLFVEDSPDDAELLARELRKGGLEFESQRVDEVGALQKALKQTRWDLVVADHSGPHIDSARALTAVRSVDADVPFIIVSGTISEETAIDAMKAGASDYLTKGRLARLVPVIERELRQAEERRSRRRLEAEGREREQRAALELALAYDATLEGWARALELRDSETEGHSRRVAALTDQLALALDVPDEDRVHIHRGALLHDIGKMAVPDGILLKPGSLTEDEWKILRQHPSHAVELLSPIEYLQPALDIPAYHHERWDGTGYPHGMSGEAIPLAARIFAVADVWDALVHARPYREAWTVKAVTSHLASLSGSHLDPHVVDAFLHLVREGRIDAGDGEPVDPGTLLVVEDTESNLQLIKRWLERDGYRVMTARTGAEALAALEAGRPDLVVLDISIPPPNGVEVCRHIKQTSGTAHVPVVLLSGSAVDDETRTLADAYLQKPAAPATLKAVVRRLLAARATVTR